MNDTTSRSKFAISFVMMLNMVAGLSLMAIFLESLIKTSTIFGLYLLPSYVFCNYYLENL